MSVYQAPNVAIPREKIEDAVTAAILNERAACAKIARQEAEFVEVRLRALMRPGTMAKREPILNEVRASIERIARAIERGER